MKQIFTALLDLWAMQALAVQSLDERLSALEKTWIFYHPAREDDLNSHLGDERRAHQESGAQLQKQIGELRELVSSLQD